jgi:hypothetical protein
MIAIEQWYLRIKQLVYQNTQWWQILKQKLFLQVLIGAHKEQYIHGVAIYKPWKMQMFVFNSFLHTIVQSQHKVTQKKSQDLLSNTNACKLGSIWNELRFLQKPY